MTYPRGIVEDILAKVDKFIFPADFIVLDFEEDKEISIILGHPFLATGRTVIDVQKGELTMRVHDQEVTFNVFKSMKYPNDVEKCFKVDWTEISVEDVAEGTIYDDPLEVALINPRASEFQASLQYLHLLNATPSYPQCAKLYEALEQSDKSAIFTKTSLEEPPILELKQLPSHLRYS